MLPLASIVDDGRYVNTASMKGNIQYQKFILLLYLVGVLSGAVTITFDKLFVLSATGQWPAWKDSNKGVQLARLLASIARLSVILTLVSHVCFFGALLQTGWHIIFGVDLSLAFKFSFNFGLLAWASFLRTSMLIQTVLEFGFILWVIWLSKRKGPSGQEQTNSEESPP